MHGQWALLRSAMPSIKRQLQVSKEIPERQIKTSIVDSALIEIGYATPKRRSLPKEKSQKSDFLNSYFIKNLYVDFIC